MRQGKRAEGPRPLARDHTAWKRVINHPVRGPSESSRLGMTAKACWLGRAKSVVQAPGTSASTLRLRRLRAGRNCLAAGQIRVFGNSVEIRFVERACVASEFLPQSRDAFRRHGPGAIPPLLSNVGENVRDLLIG